MSSFTNIPILSWAPPVSTSSNLPPGAAEGEARVVINTNTLYVYTNGAWHALSSGGSAIWGSITGTLSNQTDLQNALNTKAPTASPPFTGTVSVSGFVFRGEETNLGNVGSSETIDFSTNSAFKLVLNSSTCEITFANPTGGCSYVLHFLASGGTRTITWTDSITWLNPSAASPADLGDANTLLVNIYYDGTNYFGSFAGDYSA